MSVIPSTIPAPVIRAATEHDAGELARLMTQLGHPTTADAIVACWEEWQAAGNLALVAAMSDGSPASGGSLAGVATLHRMRVLHRPRPVGRITALVVDAPVRGKGIGRMLVAAAEESLTRAGCGLLEVTSNLRRADAHAFYEHVGFERTSLRFAKSVAPPSA